METLSKGLIDLLQFVAGMAGIVVVLLLAYIGVKLWHKIVDEL